MPGEVAVEFQEAAEGIRWGDLHPACPVRRQRVGQLRILHREYAMPRHPTRRGIRISISELPQAKRRSLKTKRRTPLESKFSRSRLEQAKRVEAVLCSRDKRLERMRSVTCP
jgi:hypothetical protein